jgi:tryptophanyl-tRNA synthetase
VSVVEVKSIISSDPVNSDAIRRGRSKVFSGIQPSGNFHLGNYLGAIRNWVAQQDQYDNVFCIVDLHALSLPTTRESLHGNIIGLANVLLAAGLDPQKSIIFVQSDVREHAELCWLLSSVTQFGELRRMTQFKDKSGGKDEQVSAALFNARYGETFVLPQPDIKATGARVMSLEDPTRKMSKSDANPNAAIALTDTADIIRRKIRRAVTDSGSEVSASPDKPALTNLLTIHSLLSGEAIPDIEDRFSGQGYGAFKSELADVVVATLEPIQTRLAELDANPEVAQDILRDGADRARARAAAKMAQVRDRIGIGS